VKTTENGDGPQGQNPHSRHRETKAEMGTQHTNQASSNARPGLKPVAPKG